LLGVEGYIGHAQFGRDGGYSHKAKAGAGEQVSRL
jgi:hypothetical protein